MIKTLYDYEIAIKALPLQKTYDKETLLSETFLLESEGHVAIYYAPHNEIVNPEAKVMIVGITPGFVQMNTAIATARTGFEEGKTIPEIQKACKVAARFSGSMRKNIISMLDELGLQERLALASSGDLFERRDELLHTVSLVPYPVFVKGKNYTGHTPKLTKSAFLMHYVHENFNMQLKQIKDKEHLLIIPLGRAVEEVVDLLEKDGVLGGAKVLRHFPHPSGANVNRLVQFETHLEEMKSQLARFL
ncbi:MAG: hypothetical protein ACRCW2_09890 [Cellulosilyticaceae bacterium]